MTTTIPTATDEEIGAFLKSHPSWSVVGAKLHRELRFADFASAFGFMAQAALVAEKNDHHPEWFNVYSRVVVDLMTHEADGITAKDFDLAAKMDEIASKA